MNEVTPAQLKLLRQAIDVQERMLNGVEEIFRGLRHHDDAEVSSVSGDALKFITHNRDVLESLIDAADQTKH